MGTETQRTAEIGLKLSSQDWKPRLIAPRPVSPVSQWCLLFPQASLEHPTHTSPSPPTVAVFILKAEVATVAVGEPSFKTFGRGYL